MMRTAVGRLGTKRQCPACGAKFYDLGRKPPTCSRCGAKVQPKKAKTAAKAGAAVEQAPPKPVPAPAPGAPPRAQPAPAAAETSRQRSGARDWTREQAEAIDRVGRWLKDGEPQVFRLFGYAGVGKTTLARHVAEAADGRNGLRRLHRQGGDGDARPRLLGRDHHPRAHLSRQRGRRRRADLHPQRGRAGLAREPDRHRRVLDGRRRAGARPPVVRQAHSGARRPVPASAGQGRRLFHRTSAGRDADGDPPPGGGQPDHPPVADRPFGRRAQGRMPTARAGSSAAPPSTPPRSWRPTRCWSA